MSLAQPYVVTDYVALPSLPSSAAGTMSPSLPLSLAIDLIFLTGLGNKLPIPITLCTYHNQSKLHYPVSGHIFTSLTSLCYTSRQSRLAWKVQV